MLFTPNLHECTTPCFFLTINPCILVTSTDQNYKPPMQQLYDNSAWLNPICVFVFLYSGRWRHKLWNDMEGIFGCHVCRSSGLGSIFFTWALQAEKCLSSNVCSISSSFTRHLYWKNQVKFIDDETSLWWISSTKESWEIWGLQSKFYRWNDEGEH